MSTNSQASAASASALPMASSVLAFAKRHLDGIDPTSLQLATKTSLAIVLSLGIAFWMDVSATITAVTALMIQQGYVGATMKRGLLRLVGGTAGAIVALGLLALFGQDRVLFIGSVALCVGVIAYFMQGTRNWYAYILAVAAMVLVGYGEIQQPENAFQFGVTWVSGILIAIVVVSLLHSLLWPTTTADIFERGLRDNLEHCRTLLRSMVEILIEGKDRRADMQRTEQSIIQGLPKLQTTLQTAAYDSWQIEKYETSYGLLLEQVTVLAQRLVHVGESVKMCQAQPALADVVQQSETLRQITHELDDRMQSLAEALAEARDGSRLRDLDQDTDALDSLLARLADEFQAVQVDVLDKAALAGLHVKLGQLGGHILKVRKALASVETASSLTSARAAAKKHQQPTPSFKPRLIKSATASLVMIAVPSVWILTNWPMALHRLMLYSAVLACLGALLPIIPRRAILTAIAFGAAGAALLYFGVLRPLDGYLELGLAVFFVALPYCYLINSSHPGSMIAGLFGGMIMIGLIDLSLVQSYSFANYINNLIGYSGGFMVCMIILQLFEFSTPEQTFCQKARLFFQTCGQSIGKLNKAPPWTSQGKAILATQQAQLLQSLNTCGLWTHLINPRRAPQNNSKKVSDLLAAMQGLLFRMEVMEQARLPVSHEAPFASLVATGHEVRISCEDSLGAIQHNISGDVAPGTWPDTDAAIAEYRRQLDALRGDPAVDETDRETAGRVLVLAGYYRALAESIDDCRKHVDALDWSQWQRSYI